MKEGNFLISEKLERTTIRFKRTHKKIDAICKHGGKQSEWLTVDEASELFNVDKELIKQALIVLRENHGKGEIK